MRRKHHAPIEEWLCGKTNDGHGQTFARVTSDLLNCQPFCALSYTAQILYVRMTVRAAGKLEFTFPHSVYKAAMCNAAFERAKNELISAGFIEIVERNGNLRLPNIYRFSMRWKDGL